MTRVRGNDIGPVGEQIANNIKRARIAAGMRLEDLSAALGEMGRAATISQLSKVENCHTNPRSEDLVFIAVALGCPTADLVDMSHPPVAATQALRTRVSA
jgi:transcriptional regulator with XRE-family HTH domain